MLSIRHPEVMLDLRTLPAGLLFFRDPGSTKLLLTIKASREAILAAQVNHGFKFYVAPLSFQIGTVPVLVTAFFDDFDEPLTIRTPIFKDDFLENLKEMLASEAIEIYFFDEHNREWASYLTRICDGGSFLTDVSEMKFLDHSIENSIMLCEQSAAWFGLRSEVDDAKSISVIFVEKIMPDDLMIMDIRPDGNNYLGGEAVSHSSLIRENPGYFQERDIVLCLNRIVGRRIVLNPVRRDTRKEFADVLFQTQDFFVLIQAKDSPNTNASLARTIERKRLTSLSHMRKGIAQARGAAAYALSNQPLSLLIGKDEVDFYTEGQRLFLIGILNETFEPDQDQYIAVSKELSEEGLIGLVLSYGALDAFTHRLNNSEEFVGGLLAYYQEILERRVYPGYFEFLLSFRSFLDERKTSLV